MQPYTLSLSRSSFTLTNRPTYLLSITVCSLVLAPTPFSLFSHGHLIFLISLYHVYVSHLHCSPINLLFSMLYLASYCLPYYNSPSHRLIIVHSCPEPFFISPYFLFSTFFNLFGSVRVNLQSLQMFLQERRSCNGKETLLLSGIANPDCSAAHGNCLESRCRPRLSLIPPILA